MGFRTGKGKIEAPLTDPWLLQKPLTRMRGTQTIVQGIVSAKNTYEVLNAPHRGNVVQQKIIQTITPEGVASVNNKRTAEASPKGLQQSSPPVTSPVVSQGFQLNPANFTKPITIMAKDPRTGQMKPVTLFPKNLKPTATQLSNLPGTRSGIRIVSPNTPSPVQQIVTTPMPIRPARKLPPLKPIEPVKPMMPESPQHGLICKEGCDCPVMLGAHVNANGLNKVWAFKRKCLKLSPRDAETILNYEWVQESIYLTLWNSLPRRDFFRLLRSVNFISAEVYDADKKRCIIIGKTCGKLTDGLIDVKGTSYPVPSVLVKLYRQGYDGESLKSIVLESKLECQMSTGESLTEENFLCINPHHYGLRTDIHDPDDCSPHNCFEYKRLIINGLDLKNVCGICLKNLTGLELVPELVDSDESQPKEPEVINLDDVNIEDLDNEFQGMLDSIEEQVNNELMSEENKDQEMTSQEEPQEEFEDFDVDTKTNLHIEIGLTIGNADFGQDPEEPEEPKESKEPKEPEEQTESKKRPLEDDDTSEPQYEVSSKRAKFLEKPEGKEFQCWQCLIWFAKKEDLKTHSCLIELKITGNVIYTCQFCATCSGDIEQLRPHVVKCKSFNLAPLRCFKKIETAITSTFIPGSNCETPSGRSKARIKKADASTAKCEACDVQFASKSEMVLHKSKAVCKSFECNLCHKFYAMERTLKTHLKSCEEDMKSKIEPSLSIADSSRVDQDIKVIKLDRSKAFHQPAKCIDCGNLLQSFELLKAHQSLINFCGNCSQKFSTTCQLLRHECPGKGPAKTTPEKPQKPKFKTDDSSLPVILKTVSDTSVPAIVDESHSRKSN